MAFTTNTYIYSGDPNFALNFALGFISRDHVQVRINAAVDGNDDPVYSSFDWIDDNNITVTAPLVNGDSVEITRTVSKSELEVDFANGADITPTNLSLQALQGLMVYQELADGRVEGATSPQASAEAAEASAVAAGQERALAQAAAQDAEETVAALGNLLFITPEYFGAVGDGVTDDSAALSAWIAAINGATGIVSTGKHYVYSEELTPISDNTSIVSLGGAVFEQTTWGFYGLRVDGNNVVARNIHVKSTQTRTELPSGLADRYEGSGARARSSAWYITGDDFTGFGCSGDGFVAAFRPAAKRIYVENQTISGATVNTMPLEGRDPEVDDFYNGMVIRALGVTDTREVEIVDYDSASNAITIAHPDSANADWTAAPNGSGVYYVIYEKRQQNIKLNNCWGNDVDFAFIPIWFDGMTLDGCWATNIANTQNVAPHGLYAPSSPWALRSRNLDAGTFVVTDVDGASAFKLRGVDGVTGFVKSVRADQALQLENCSGVNLTGWDAVDIGAGSTSAINGATVKGGHGIHLGSGTATVSDLYGGSDTIQGLLVESDIDGQGPYDAVTAVFGDHVSLSNNTDVSSNVVQTREGSSSTVPVAVETVRIASIVGEFNHPTSTKTHRALRCGLSTDVFVGEGVITGTGNVSLEIIRTSSDCERCSIGYDKFNSFAVENIQGDTNFVRYLADQSIEEITVGQSGADFQRMTDAFNSARVMSLTKTRTHPLISIVVEDDYRWDEAVTITHGFYPVTVRQRNGNDVLAHSSLPSGVPMISMYNATGVVMDIQLDCNGEGEGGVKLVRSDLIWRRGGVRGGMAQASNESGYNLFVSKNSTFTSTAELADGVLLDFTGAQKRGIWVTRESRAEIDFCDFSDTGSTGGLDPVVEVVAAVFASRESSVYGTSGRSNDSSGHHLRAARSRVCIRDWDAQRSGLAAIWAFERAVVTSRICDFTDSAGIVLITQGGADVDINGSTATGLTGPVLDATEGSGNVTLDDIDAAVTSGNTLVVGGAYQVNALRSVITGGDSVLLSDGAICCAVGAEIDSAFTGDVVRVQSGARLVLRNGRVHSTAGTPSNWVACSGGGFVSANGLDIGASGSVVPVDVATHTNLSAANTWASNGAVFTSG